MTRMHTKKTVGAGMLMAVGVILPYFTAHGFGMPGNVLLPMHIPVLLAGLLCGPFYGALCGVLIPCLSAIFTGMPSFYPMLPIMTGELCTYGIISGLLFHKTALHQKSWGSYIALIGAMACGRVIYGIIFSILWGLDPQLKALSMPAAILTGLPGIILQVIIIPPIVMAVVRALRDTQKNKEGVTEQMEEAITLIRSGKASCVVIKDGKILRKLNDRGIGPVISLYEEGIINNAEVADKIIGKAAAMILVLGNVKKVYGETMSKEAEKYLKMHHIEVGYGRCIDVIRNREGNGICPMERAVMAIDEPKEALEVLKQTLAKLRKEA